VTSTVQPGQPRDLEEQLRYALPGVWVRWLEEVDSTSSALRRQLEHGDLPAPALLAADRQTGGRGTRGRQWVQPAASAGLDLALTLAAPLREFWQSEQRLSMLIGAQLALALEAVCGMQFGLKWPNDMLLLREGRWRKCGGLLLETIPESGRPWLLCGLGLNLNSRLADYPADLQPVLTTAAESAGRPMDRGTAALAVARALCALLLAEELPDTARLLAAWQTRDQTRQVRYVLRRDGQRVPVTAEGVDLATGALRVRLPGGALTLVHSYTELETA
jgi:BirA family biotin operon repressor/biotin-[acetyl-CoA-carboxylase] ligase